MRKNKKQFSEQDIERVLQPKYEALRDVMIVQLGKNKIEMFGKYLVIKEELHHQVIRITDDSVRQFRNSKSAAAWCILDKINKVVESKRLVELDQRISSLELEQILYQTHSKRLIDNGIKASKLSEIRRKITAFSKEIDGYIKIAAKVQTNKFQIRVSESFKT